MPQLILGLIVLGGIAYLVYIGISSSKRDAIKTKEKILEEIAEKEEDLLYDEQILEATRRLKAFEEKLNKNEDET